MALAGTAWTLVAFETADAGVISVVPGAPATLEFSAEDEQTGGETQVLIHKRCQAAREGRGRSQALLDCPYGLLS